MATIQAADPDGAMNLWTNSSLSTGKARRRPLLTEKH
jgi:hypothetical protein